MITYDMTRKWKSIDTETTRKIAHKCTSGVTFSTSSKKDIFLSMNEKHSGYTKDLLKFIFMMEQASKDMPAIEKAYKDSVINLIDSKSIEWQENHKIQTL